MISDEELEQRASAERLERLTNAVELIAVLFYRQTLRRITDGELRDGESRFDFLNEDLLAIWEVLKDTEFLGAGDKP